MHPHAIKIALDHNRSLDAGGHRSVQIEQLQHLTEASGELVFGRPIIQRATGIGDHLAVQVANRNHDAPAHQARPRVKSHAKFGGGSRIDSTLRQVRMIPLHAGQSETERKVALFFFPNQLPLRPARGHWIQPQP